jgi:nucleotide-binding universal stress UspA family protein
MFRDIMVHLKAQEEWSPHIDYAISVAASFRARLRGFMTFSEVASLRSLSRYDEKHILEQRERDAAAAARMRERFLSAANSSQVECELITGEGPANELVTFAARLHDLTIVEQRDPRRDELGYDPAEEAVLSAGRPVVLIPRIGRFDPAPKGVLLAWNGSLQSATALHYALPFIEAAEKAVVCLGPRRSHDRPRSISHEPALDIRAHLLRRVQQVEVENTEAGADDIGEHLLSRANEHNAGMLVMGAYGRSWLSEWVLGGATRHVLRHMSLPVLMGH